MILNLTEGSNSVLTAGIPPSSLSFKYFIMLDLVIEVCLLCSISSSAVGPALYIQNCVILVTDPGY